MDLFEKNEIGLSITVVEAQVIRNALRDYDAPAPQIPEMASQLDAMIREIRPEWVPDEPDEPTVDGVNPRAEEVTYCAYCGHKYPEGYASQAGVVGIVNGVLQWYCAKRCLNDHEVAQPAEGLYPPIG